MAEYKLESLRGPSLIWATVTGAVVISLLTWARLASGGGQWVLLIDVAIGTIAIVLPIFLIIGLWRRGCVSLAHKVAEDTDSIAFVSVRTPSLIDALRSIVGHVGAVPGQFVVSITDEYVHLLVPRPSGVHCILSLPAGRVENVVAGRISEGTRMTNGVILYLSGGREDLRLPLVATGAGLGGVLELPASTVECLRAAIEAKISLRT